MHDATRRHNIIIIMMPALSHNDIDVLLIHWAILSHVDAFRTALSYFDAWADQFTFELGAQNAIVNSAHAQAAQYGVDSGRQKLKTWLYLEKEGVLVLIACLASV